MKLLRQTIRSILKEALKFDQFENLALYEGMWDNDKLYFLFDVEFIQELIREYSSHGLDIKFDDARRLGLSSDHLYGMVSTAPPGSTGNDCNDAAIINYAAAKDGWGPTIYDIVMGLHPDGVIADREEVSSAAFTLWKFYHENRNDVEKIPLDHEWYGWTPATVDDCGPGSNGHYLPAGWKNGSKDHDTFLEDPLSWSYNRDPVPNMEQLRTNWDSAYTMAMENGLNLSAEFWEYLAQGFYSRWE